MAFIAQGSDEVEMDMKRGLLCALALTLLAPALNAAVIVSWGPATDIVTASQSMISGKNSTRMVDFSSFANPAVGANYYPNNTGKTPRFYGAAFSTLAVSPTVTSGTTFSVSNGANAGTPPVPTNDTLFTSINGALNVNAAYIWRQPEFLDGSMASSGVSLDGMTAIVSDNGSGTVTETRFIIQVNNGSYYITSNFYPEGTPTLNLLTAMWANYLPSTDFSAFGTPVTLTATDLQQVTAAGLTLFSRANASTGGTVQGRVASFQVNATIPEPATASVALAAGAAGLARRRRA